eukprot:gene3629-4563_t
MEDEEGEEENRCVSCEDDEDSVQEVTPKTAEVTPKATVMWDSTEDNLVTFERERNQLIAKRKAYMKELGLDKTAGLGQ